jgi:hypothetical protein
MLKCHVMPLSLVFYSSMGEPSTRCNRVYVTPLSRMSPTLGAKSLHHTHRILSAF